MLIALGLAVLPLAQGSAALINMPDQQFCEIITQTMAQPRPGTATVQTSSVADCATKRVNMQLDVALTGAPYSQFKTSYLANARTAVCNMQSNTWRTFAMRGWKYHYNFLGTGGEMEEVTLDCAVE
jgi:hypothetical protein